MCAYRRRPEWPPWESIGVYLAPAGTSCKQACRRVGRICEPAYLPSMNSLYDLHMYGVLCADAEYLDEPWLPAFESVSRKCYLMKQDQLLFSCADLPPSPSPSPSPSPVGAATEFQRVCTCRDYIPDQTALCARCRT